MCPSHTRRPLSNTAHPAKYSAARQITRQTILRANDKSRGTTTLDDNGELPPTTDDDDDEDEDDNDYDNDDDDDDDDDDNEKKSSTKRLSFAISAQSHGLVRSRFLWVGKCRPHSTKKQK